MGYGIAQAIGTLAAAGIGAFGAWWYGRRARVAAESELLIRNYLVQLQEATESLAHRIINVQRHNGIESMASIDYYRESSRYAIATFLGQHRRLTADGVFGHLELRWPGFGTSVQELLLQSERELGSLADHSFQRYHRRELADLSLDWTTERLRPVSYSTFRLLMAEPAQQPTRAAADRATEDFVAADQLIAALELVSLAIGDKTGIASSIDRYARPPTRQPRPPTSQHSQREA